MLSIILGVVESEDLRAFCVVHVFRIVIVFVEVLLDYLIVEFLSGHVDLVQLQSAYLSWHLLQYALFFTRSDLATLFIIIDNL